MKCPNCGKKMKKNVCKACGYDPAAKPEAPAAPAMPNPAMRVNYYTYDPANPSVVYPMSISGQAQTNPAIVGTAPMQPAAPAAPAVPVSKKAAKKAAKAEKKAAKKSTKGMSKADKKAAKKAAKVAKKVAKKSGVSVLDVPVRKNVASRLFAIVLIALCAFVSVVLTYYVLVDVSYYGSNTIPKYEAGSLMAIVMGAFAAEGNLFGVLPAYSIGGTTGMLYNLTIYAFALCVVIALLHAVFAIFSKAKAPRRVRRALFFLGIGALAYSVMFALMINRWGLDVAILTDLITVAGYSFDPFSLIVGAACLVLSLLFLIFRRRK